MFVGFVDCVVVLVVNENDLRGRSMGVYGIFILIFFRLFWDRYRFRDLFIGFEFWD